MMQCRRPAWFGSVRPNRLLPHQVSARAMSLQQLPSYQDVRVLPMGAEVQLVCRGTAADHRLQVSLAMTCEEQL
jgi:hypothetical protein